MARPVLGALGAARARMTATTARTTPLGKNAPTATRMRATRSSPRINARLAAIRAIATPPVHANHARNAWMRNVRSGARVNAKRTTFARAEIASMALAATRPAQGRAKRAIASRGCACRCPSEWRANAQWGNFAAIWGPAKKRRRSRLVSCAPR